LPSRNGWLKPPEKLFNGADTCTPQMRPLRAFARPGKEQIVLDDGSAELAAELMALQ